MSSGGASGHRLSLSASLLDQFHKLVDILIQGERECPLSLLDNVITSEDISLDCKNIVPAHYFDPIAPDYLPDLEQALFADNYTHAPCLSSHNTVKNSSLEKGIQTSWQSKEDRARLTIGNLANYEDQANNAYYEDE